MSTVVLFTVVVVPVTVKSPQIKTLLAVISSLNNLPFTVISAKATLLVYFNNPVAIGEHPQHLEEMDKLLVDIADANDKLEMLNKHFRDLEVN